MTFPAKPLVASGASTVTKTTARSTRTMKRLDVGAGVPVLILHGFGLSPTSYRRSAELLSDRRRLRVIVPSLFDMEGRWTPEAALTRLIAMLDDLDLEQVSVVGHSFGGCFELGLAAACPERLSELVFCDTLGLSRSLRLAHQALHPANLLLLATPGAALDFAHTWLTHPIAVTQAAWHGFAGDHHPDIDAVRRAGLRSHVLWAERDTLLSQAEGSMFAERIGAAFHVVSPLPGGKTVDHNWMYRCPELFVSQLERLDLRLWEPDSAVPD
jgi:pimeloyl-ACP methyl ester carboxylesterase